MTGQKFPHFIFWQLIINSIWARKEWDAFLSGRKSFGFMGLLAKNG